MPGVPEAPRGRENAKRTIAVNRQEVSQWSGPGSRRDRSSESAESATGAYCTRVPRSARSGHGPRATARVDRRATTTPNLTVPFHYRAGAASPPPPRQGTTGRAQLSPRQPTDVGLTRHIGGAAARAGLGPPHPHGQGASDTMIDVMSRLGEVKVKTAEALRASEADERASVVLVAVVREFDSKADKANRQANARDSVIELEQAGDSAKAAAEADPNLGESARQAVLDAHLAICILKTEI